MRIDHNLTQYQRMYGRVSWYDRNSNYNNYFDNLSTGQWFRFISRQVALDHVWTMNSTTVLNIRYGFDRFTRGDQGNPANHGFDLTVARVPGVLRERDSGEHPQVPALRYRRLSRERAWRARIDQSRTRRRWPW